MFLNVNTIRLHYQVSGSGQPLILIHGNQEDLTIFTELTTVLNKNYRVYQLDSRNHGLSSQSPDYHYQTMANDVVAFINQLGLTQVNLLGFSDGAIISLLVSHLIPEKIHTLALLGINLSPKDFKPAIYAEIEAEYQREHNPLTRLMLTEPQLGLADLAATPLPTLVVAGENDCCSAEFFEDVAMSLPQGELLVFSNHDHSNYIVHQSLLAQPLHEFIQKNTPA